MCIHKNVLRFTPITYTLYIKIKNVDLNTLISNYYAICNISYVLIFFKVVKVTLDVLLQEL